MEFMKVSPFVLKERLIVVLLMMLGGGGLWSASAQTEILEAIDCTGSIPGFPAFTFSRYSETNSVPPLWSG